MTCTGMQASIAGRLGNTKESMVSRVQISKIHLPNSGIWAQKVSIYCLSPGGCAAAPELFGLIYNC